MFRATPSSHSLFRVLVSPALLALCVAGCTGVEDTGNKDTGATVKPDGQPTQPDALPGLVPCQGDPDCKRPGACPPDAKMGCVCRRGPIGGPLNCMPACKTPTDCPKPPNTTMVCTMSGLCVPMRR